MENRAPRSPELWEFTDNSGKNHILHKLPLIWAHTGFRDVGNTVMPLWGFFSFVGIFPLYGFFPLVDFSLVEFCLFLFSPGHLSLLVARLQEETH